MLTCMQIPMKNIIIRMHMNGLTHPQPALPTELLLHWLQCGPFVRVHSYDTIHMHCHNDMIRVSLYVSVYLHAFL